MRYFIPFTGLFLLISLLAACGSDDAISSDYPVPEELVNNSEPGMEDFEDQHGLKIGETGYLVEIAHRTVFSVTLNEVAIVEEYGGVSFNDERIFMVGNFTISNFGENAISKQGLEFPVLAKVSDVSRIEDGTGLSRQELLGFGAGTSPESRIDMESIEPGDEVTGDIAMVIEEEAEEYVIWFGYQGYNNNVTFEVSASEAKR